MTPTKLTLFIIWAVMSLITTAGMNANLRASFPKLDQSPRQARQHFAFAVFIGVLPPGWVAAFFVTGFYMDGFTLNSAPFPCTGTPEIWCK